MATLARWQATITDAAGNVMPGAQVRVRQETTGFPLATIWQDRDGTVPAANPLTVDANGYVFFHALGSAYRITATSGAWSREWRYVPNGTLAERDSEEFVLTSDFTAANLPFTPSGNLASTNVQDALVELDSEKANWTPASSSGPASIDLHEDTDNGTNRGRLTVPSSLTGDRTYTFPDANMSFSAFMAGLMSSSNAIVLQAGAGLRRKLTGSTTLYVQTTGNDTTGDGSSGAPFATPQKAVDTILDTFDCAGFSVWVNIGAGTFDRILVNRPGVGLGVYGIMITGAGASSTTIRGTANHAVSISGGGRVWIGNLKVETITSGDGINVSTNGQVDSGWWGAVEFGACVNSHLTIGSEGTIFWTTAYTITGGAQSHLHAGGEGTITLGSQTVTITGTPNFSAYFAGLNKGSIECSGVVWSGSATGKRFVCHYNGTLNLGIGRSMNSLPGDSAGTVDNGGIVISSEGAAYDPQVAWQATTPTPTPGSGSFTSASCAMRHKREGTICHAKGSVTLTTIGTGATSVIVPLPYSSVGASAGHAVNTSLLTNAISAYVAASSGNLVITPATYPSNGHVLHFELTYEVAP